MKKNIYIYITISKITTGKVQNHIFASTPTRMLRNPQANNSLTTTPQQRYYDATMLQGEIIIQTVV